MIQTTQISSMAKVEVQQNFCTRCAIGIKSELQKLAAIKHIRIYPEDSMILFNFGSAFDLSTALNTLAEIGYYEIGDRSDYNYQHNRNCNC